MPAQEPLQRDDVPLVQVDEVSVREQEALAHGLSIELPTSDTRSHDSYSFPLEGRLESPRSLVGMDLFHAGTRLHRVWERRPGADAGPVPLSWAVNALALPSSFDAELRAVRADRSQIPLVTIRGRRAPLHTGFEPAMQPLSITSLGRSGSTALMRALERHPEIASCPAFAYETRVSLYWLSVLRDLSEPAGYRRQIVNSPETRIGGTEWWRAGRRPRPPAPADLRLERIVGRDSIRQLALACQSQIDLVHRQLADRFGRPGAAYFAEKTIAGPLLSLLDELYPGAREVVLIRDFRDQLCSVVSFYSRQGVLDVQPDRDHVMKLAGQARKSAMALLDRSRRSAGRIHVLRYEDMVLAPTETFTALLEYLALAADPGVLTDMANAVTQRDPGTESHRTVSDPGASVGRWKRDLEPEVADAAAAELSVPLEAFGYS